ncbi:hypothetical protein [Laspinema palackyanum]|nr:hypothetical protein [Laspinema sp. D2c]
MNPLIVLNPGSAIGGDRQIREMPDSSLNSQRRSGWRQLIRVWGEVQCN